MSKTILVTNGTGKQGKAVIDALLKSHMDFTILATTRDASTPSAKSLAGKSPKIKIVQGNLNDVPALFDKALRSTKSRKIWGVFSVQVYTGKGVTNEGEIQQGKAVICEAVKHGVEYFVYASVDRGGDDVSWTNPTSVPHFATKIPIETCLKDEAGSMSWCILRPVGFMENWEPGFPAKVFLTALRNKIPAHKKLQFIATRDIGIFAAKAFTFPADFSHKAISLAGDELTVEELDTAFERATGTRLGTTWSPLGNALTRFVPELGSMFRWFAVEGFHADVAACREMHPELMDFVTWLRLESGFVKRD